MGSEELGLGLSILVAAEVVPPSGSVSVQNMSSAACDDDVLSTNFN
jgi:hypothetical protein